MSYFYQQPQTDRIYFKGGTALRTLYDSPRFSEDLDFSSSLTSIRPMEQAVLETLAEIERENIHYMKTNEMDFKIGDCVRVRAGIQDPDWDQDLSGWQGRVSSIDHPKRGKPTVIIAWDSVTLRQMSATAIEKCEVDGLDWSEYGLDVDEIESAVCRDTPRDVERAKKEIAKQYRWVYLGDEGKRIQKILAGVDPDDVMRLLDCWEEYYDAMLPSARVGLAQGDMLRWKRCH
ncbi:MAG: nucleotidyl transferase AbiEii/AbiGii toxin family protein [Chloroflexi bacterium]|nr:nucleotidyl transferase AbiEii/AbiGii toxin family protein [Chloroflexota bacterium]